MYAFFLFCAFMYVTVQFEYYKLLFVCDGMG